MADQGDKLDIIIFGATGYTGKVAVEQLVKIAKEKNITWGVSGRNQSKLEAVLKEVGEITGGDLSKIPIVVADVSDEESLKKMASRARVVANFVGPYMFYGEPVVKSCVYSGTHHVDISGEPQYLEKMQLEYNEAAQDKGVYVVGACGMDSIPSDLGIVHLKNQFQGDVNSVEMYLELWSDKPTQSGAHLNFGTFESAVLSIAHYKELRPLRTKLFPNRLPELKPHLKSRGVVHRRDKLGWCLPFPGPDRSVILRSQRHFFEVDKERPIQVQMYCIFKSIIPILAIAFFGMFFIVLSKFALGRKLLLKYPGFFTGGAISREGPTQESRESSGATLHLYGEGWTEKLSEPTDQHAEPPNKKALVKVTLRDAAYEATSVMLLLAAVTVLRESDKMPGKGGVLPPAAAFAKTSLIDELNKHNIKFQVESRVPSSNL